MKAVALRLWQRPYVLLGLTILFWSGNSIIGRAVRDSVPPLTLAAFRWIGATALLLPFAMPHIRKDAPLLRAHWRIIFLLGLVGVAGFNSFLYAGLRYTTASNALLIQAATAPFILLIAWAWHGERTSPVRLLATALSMAGVIVIVVQGNIQTLLHLELNIGDVLVLVAAILWAVYTVMLPQRPDLHPLSFMTIAFMIGVVVVTPLAALEMLNGAQLLWSRGSLGAIVYVALFPSLIAYLFYVQAVSLIGGAVAGQIINAMPLVGAFLAVILLGEPLAAYHFVGMAMILAGIIWFARSR